MVLHLLVKFQCFTLLLWLQLASSEILTTGSRVLPKPDCPDKCGSVSIPFPFGVGDGCFIDELFEMICTDGILTSPKAMNQMFDISHISVLEGEMTIQAYIARDCSGSELSEQYDNLAGHIEKFTFSSTKNKFIGIGCDTLAYLGLPGTSSVGTGCLSICSKIADTLDGSCTGVGCCQSSVPAGLSTVIAIVKSVYSTRTPLSFNPCSYAFVIEESSFNFSLSYLRDFKNHGTETVPVVVDWTVGNEACHEAKRNSIRYACGNHTDCIDGGIKSLGYRCNCTKGYAGNPYLQSSTSGGCKDINECEEFCLNGTCKNTDGNYSCTSCHKGYRLNSFGSDCIPDDSKSQRTLYMIVIGAFLGLCLLLVASFWLYWGYRKRKHMKVKEEFFKQNGGLILSRLLDEREDDIESSRNGKGEKKHRSIAKIYTEKELRKATNNYHESQILGQGGFGTVYKGTLPDGDVVAIKKTKVMDRSQNEQFINEIAVLSQINHKNVVQLLGCCLESEVPLLVYEFIANGTLHQHLHGTGSAALSWEDRLRIASEVAGSLAYLHAEASIPIIHRDVKSSNVLLDGEYKAKVSDFGGSRLNPTDQAQLTTVVQGTMGYLDPEYMQSNQLTEKSDVYSFGVLLVELLTGKAVISFARPEEDRNLGSYFLSTMKTNRLFTILDSSLVLNDNERVSSVHGHQQIQQMAELAQKCLRVKGEKRPTMKEVAMALHGLIMMSSSSCPDVLEDEDLINISKEERMLLSESAKLISYTDSISTVGDTSRGILALETEGR
ncbi:hypothetical protein C5167_030563 [Papaver somniferum]|uniref:wall-associated receptor kinase 2-like n=1 Tax=Papaver somniferum TaxID=3469 RepID=UPI000E7007D5|nr:wall-associated receptor kinase 2-like [Papaver somniferum]RZC86487.1 hypothetical protein C5167_030563 [Papaver somniferum]